jgi:hypothetical protein
VVAHSAVTVQHHVAEVLSHLWSLLDKVVTGQRYAADFFPCQPKVEL